MDRRWLILLVVFVSRTGLGFQFQTLGSVSPHLIDELSLNYREIGTLIGLFTLAGIFLSIPAGMALRFATDRWLVIIGLTLLGIGGALAAISQGISLLVIGRLICGIGFVLSTLYFAKMVTDWFAGRELATAMGILVMSWPVGIALAQVVQPIIANNLGWQTSFTVAAAFCFIGAIFVAMFYRSPPGADSGRVAAAPVVNRLSRNHWQLTLIASLVWAFFNAGYVIYLSFAHDMLVFNGMDPIRAAAFASIPSWIMLFSSIVAGSIADKTGRRDSILYIGMVCAAVAMLAIVINGAALPAVILFGLVGAAPAGVIIALTAEAMPANARAFGMGVFFTSYFVLTTPAPAIAGWLFDRSGTPAWPMVFAASAFVAAAVSNWVFRVVQGKQNREIAATG